MGFWWFIIQIAAMFALSLALQPKVKFQKRKPLTAADFDIPTAEEGRPIPMIFGKKLCKGPNVVWYGDINAVPIYKKVRTGLFNHKRQLQGFMYYMGMHMILCQGNTDGVKQIWVGEKCLWPVVNDPSQQAADGQTTATIAASNIFGGIEKEGGVAGSVTIEYGGISQGQNAYLVSKLGGLIPAYRWLTGLVLNHVYLTNNGYPKPWSALIKRTDKLTDGTPQWYLAKANIDDDDINPVHMIRECLTDNENGLGEPSTEINDTSFVYAADTLFAEGLGISANWDASVPLDEFIGVILEIIDGALYQNQSTGLWQLVLARPDYAPGTLPIYDETDIIEMEDFVRPSPGDLPTQVTVRWTDRLTDTPRQSIAHNIALMSSQMGNNVPVDFDYGFIHNGSIAGMVANRELKQATAMLATFTLRCLRTMASLAPNDVFKISWPEHGLTEVIVRVLSIDYGELDSPEMRVYCTEDVFGTAYNTYADLPDTKWANVQNTPVDTSYRLLIEAPYWNLCRDLYSQSIVDGMPATTSYFIASAAKPVADAFDYDLYVQDDTEGFTAEGSGIFTPTATLTNALPIGGVDVVVDLSNEIDLISVEVDTWALIDNEILKVVSVGTDQVTLARGHLDTLPAAHSAGARIWFIESGMTLVEREYSTGDTPDAKFLTRTSLGTLDVGSATAESASAFNDRIIRPYPPARLRINGSYFPPYFTGEPTLDWRHRTRESLSVLIDWDEDANYGPEATTTYTLKIYDEDNSLVRTETGLTGTSYTYTEANERSDCGLGPTDALNSTLRFVLFSVRGSYDSWQSYDITVERGMQGVSAASATVSGDLSVEHILQGSASVSATSIGVLTTS